MNEEALLGWRNVKSATRKWIQNTNVKKIQSYKRQKLGMKRADQGREM